MIKFGDIIRLQLKDGIVNSTFMGRYYNYILSADFDKYQNMTIRIINYRFSFFKDENSINELDFRRLLNRQIKVISIIGFDSKYEDDIDNLNLLNNHVTNLSHGFSKKKKINVTQDEINYLKLKNDVYSNGKITIEVLP